MKSSIVSVLVTSSVLACSTLGGPPPITSTFDTDAEGWMVQGFNNDQNDYRNGSTPAATTFDATGGVSGGAAKREDLIGWGDYFVAPAKFLGDLSGYFGGTLRYEIRDQSIDSPFSAATIVLDCGSTQYLYEDSSSAGTTFTPFTIPLKSGSWASAANGTTATDDDLRACLSSVTALYVRAEYSGSIDESWIDDVELSR